MQIGRSADDLVEQEQFAGAAFLAIFDDRRQTEIQRLRDGWALDPDPVRNSRRDDLALEGLPLRVAAAQTRTLPPRSVPVGGRRMGSIFAVVAALLMVGALVMPVTGLLVRPDVRGARHGAEMIVYLGRLGWYGYVAVSVVVLTVGLVCVAAGTPGRRRSAVGAAYFLLVLTLVFGTIHVYVVATGVFLGDGRPLSALAAGVAEAVAVTVLILARVGLRRTG